jgi:hypothetical protein
MNGKGDLEPVRPFMDNFSISLIVIYIYVSSPYWTFFCLFLNQKAAIAGKAGGGSWKEISFDNF